MFIERKTRAGKVYVYRMLLKFKTSVKKIFLTSLRTTVSFVKQVSSDITLFLLDIVRCPVLTFRPVLIKIDERKLMWVLNNLKETIGTCTSIDLRK